MVVEVWWEGGGGGVVWLCLWVGKGKGMDGVGRLKKDAASARKLLFKSAAVVCIVLAWLLLRVLCNHTKTHKTTI